MISGASGRKRVQPTDLERINVPLPSLLVQRAFVEHWQESRKAINEAGDSIVRIKKSVSADFVDALGLKMPNEASNQRTFAVWWKDFLRWSVSYSKAILNSVDLTQGKYPVVKLGSILDMVQYGTSEKANTNGLGTPVVRMNNIVDGELDLTDLKYVKLSEKETLNLTLRDGDILFNRTNSKELVGKCAVFHKERQFVFASYLIRVRTTPEKANPDYVAFFINSPLGRQQIDAISRSIIGQANVNSEELRDLDIPLPPLSVQEAIMREVAKGRERIAHEQETVANRSANVTREVEEMILGQRIVAST